MTGPLYPPGPQPGSNAIGLFQIGVSPIGDIPPFDWWKTVISQYANADTLTKILANFFQYVDQTKNMSEFFDLIWNVDTAVGYGLDVWGRIVGVERVLQVVVGDWFGFANALPGADTFGQGAFYSGQDLTDNYRLTDEAYRLLIFAKAASNISDGSIPSINRILMNLFPNRGNCYVTEGGPVGDYFGFAQAHASTFGEAPFYSGQSLPRMTMSYVFEFVLTPVELAIVQSSGVLPKPVGVKATVVQI